MARKSIIHEAWEDHEIKALALEIDVMASIPPPQPDPRLTDFMKRLFKALPPQPPRPAAHADDEACLDALEEERRRRGMKKLNQYRRERILDALEGADPVVPLTKVGVQR